MRYCKMLMRQSVGEDNGTVARMPVQIISSSNDVTLARVLIDKNEMENEDSMDILYDDDDDIKEIPLPRKPTPPLICIDDDNPPMTESNENIQSSIESLPPTVYNDYHESLPDYKDIASVIVLEENEDMPLTEYNENIPEDKQSPNKDREAKDMINENTKTVYKRKSQAKNNTHTNDHINEISANFSSSKENDYLPKAIDVPRNISQQTNTQVDELRQPSSISLTVNKISFQQTINYSSNLSLSFSSSTGNKNHKSLIERNAEAVSNLNQSSASIVNFDKNVNQSAASVVDSNKSLNCSSSSGIISNADNNFSNYIDKSSIQYNTDSASLNSSSLPVASSEMNLNESPFQSQFNNPVNIMVRSSSHVVNSNENINISESQVKYTSVDSPVDWYAAVCNNQYAPSPACGVLSSINSCESPANANTCVLSTQKNASPVSSYRYGDLQNSDALNIDEDPIVVNNERHSAISSPGNQRKEREIPESIQPVNESVTTNIQPQYTTLCSSRQHHLSSTLQEKPGKPCDLHVTSWDTHHIDLEWTHPKSNDRSYPSHYIIELRKRSDNWKKVMDVPVSQNTASVTDLKPGRIYWFRVRAVNTAGPGEPSNITLPLVPILPKRRTPSKPGPLKIKDYDRNFVKLQWSAPDTDGESPLTCYVIYKKEGFSRKWVAFYKVPGDQTTATIPNLNENNIYAFRIQAANKIGLGLAGDPTAPYVPRPNMCRLQNILSTLNNKSCLNNKNLSEVRLRRKRLYQELKELDYTEKKLLKESKEIEAEKKLNNNYYKKYYGSLSSTEAGSSSSENTETVGDGNAEVTDYEQSESSDGNAEVTDYEQSESTDGNAEVTDYEQSESTDESESE